MLLRRVHSAASGAVQRRACLTTMPVSGGMAVDLSGRVACVTGAKQGFGRATADRLAEFGAEVICADIDPSIVSDERISDNRRQHGVVCDVADVGSVQAMCDEAVSSLGRLDIMVCNAGVLWSTRILDITPQEWRATMDVNLDGVFFCVQAAAKAMVAQGEGGRIVTISSSAGRSVSTVGGCHYTASKAGVLGISRAAAHELAGSDITVNAVCPGLFETEMVMENVHAWG